MKTLAIAGTDTDTGKTILTGALLAYCQQHLSDQSLGLMKPVQSGVGDREWFQEIFDLDQSPQSLNPQFFEAPLAPPLAAEQEGREIDLGQVWRELQALRNSRDLLLVEFLGGLGSPVTRELTVADLARDWRLPTLLVVPVKLGAIAQAVANVALARQMKVNLLGIILNCVEPRSPEQIAQWTPQDLIESLTQVRVLGCIPHLADCRDTSKLAAVAASLDLETILGRVSARLS
ncbi:MAG: dethiobiotin synthase [Sodalinema sp.]|jgi:dethiobiotin synthetase|uniref:dethiobiotin synthase n=1 Tax=Sodalinema sp. TaxID=3080550 RepID=UPI000B40029B|nr:MAG: ATP-dependent dethiobiotin synthetase BioD [Phormidium sp. SL48-SHIP]